VVEQRSDKTLVQRILAREHDACVELVREHHAPIYRLLFHWCRNEHQAEDLTQETFASAWTGLKGFSGASSLRTWLHRIAFRKFVDSERRGSLRNAVGEPAIDAVDEDSPDPVKLAVADEDAQRLYEALSQLEPDENHVVVLHYLQGLNYEEISAVLGVPAGTLRWRKSRAMESLRRLLQEKLEYET